MCVYDVEMGVLEADYETGSSHFWLPIIFYYSHATFLNYNSYKNLWSCTNNHNISAARGSELGLVRHH